MNANLMGQNPNGATAPSQNLNESPVDTPVSRSTFDMKHTVLDAYQFDKISPITAFNAVQGDNISINVTPNLRSYTLAAPILSGLHAHVGYFSIPKSAILPNTYDLFKVPPKIGDDVDYKVNSVIWLRELLYVIRAYWVKMGDALAGTTTLTNTCATSLIRAYSMFVNIISDASIFRRLDIATYSHEAFVEHWLNDSLFSSIRSNYQDYFGTPLSTDAVKSIDDYIDLIVPLLWENLTVTYKIAFDDDTETSRTFVIAEDSVFNVANFRNMVADFGRYNCSVTSVTRKFTDFANTFTGEEQLFTGYGAVYSSFIYPLFTSGGAASFTIYNNSYINVERVLAYQLACAEFFTNDKVEEVCTAEKYLGYLRQCGDLLVQRQNELNGTSYYSDTYFYINNQKYYYDVASWGYLENMLSKILLGFAGGDDCVIDDTYMLYVSAFINGFFGYHNSLLYSNYFLDAKTSPLASADASTSIGYSTSENTGALATVRNLLVTRYLNAVNNIPNKLVEFCKKMFGVTPTERVPQPSYCGSQSFKVGNSETVNTGDDQGAYTSQFISQEQNSSVAISFTDDSILLALLWFDMPRCMGDVTTRFAFHYDRFDDFQPYLENVGDQNIYRGELFPQYAVTPNESATASNYGFANRFAEYKQMISTARGAFMCSQSAIDDWAYTYRPLLARDAFINDYSIRNTNEEFDRFYKSLSHVSPANYFHFICANDVDLIAQRPMKYSSQILY